MIIRFVKTLLVFQLGLFALVVAYDNVVDYATNYASVSHILGMETTFTGTDLRHRAIDSATFDRIAYALIIATEFVTGALCVAGAVRLLPLISLPRDFAAAKGLAALGLALGFSLWFFGFLTIAGEWFAMWQAGPWNAQQSAFRIVAVFGVVLILIAQPEAETA